MTIFGEKTQQKRKFECLKRSGLEYDERNKNLKNYNILRSVFWCM